jgi:hypothetical protein
MGNFVPGSAIAVSQQLGADNRTDVFLVDQNGQLSVYWVNKNGPWQGPGTIGPAGIANTGGFLATSHLGQLGLGFTYVFLVDKNERFIVYEVEDARPWNYSAPPVGSQGRVNPGCFLAASQQFGLQQTDVFLVDKHGQLNVFWEGETRTKPEWRGPGPIGPAGIANPGCFLAVSQQFGADNQTDVFLVDKHGQLNVYWVNKDGQWQGPGPIGPAGIANPGCFLAASQQFGADNQTDVFLVDRYGQLNVYWVNKDGQWQGPGPIG